MTPGEAEEFKAAIESNDASKLSLSSVRNIQKRVDALDSQNRTKFLKLPFGKGDDGSWKLKPFNDDTFDAISGGFYNLVK